MKKVLMIAPSMRRGGMERQLATFLHAYDRKKLQVTLALFNKDIHYQLPPDVTIIDLNKGRRPDILFSLRLTKLIIGSKHDVINIKISTISIYILIICGFLKKSNVVIEIRTSGDHLLPFYKNVSRLFKLFKLKWTLVFNSKNEFERAKSSLPPIEIEFIANGIDTDKFLRQSSEYRKSFTIGYVGRILPLKNLETLIKAVALVKGHEMALNKVVKLVITGNVDDTQYLGKLKDLIRSLKLGNTVAFQNSLEDIEHYYSQLDLFVLPSLYEGTPNVLLEAMSCECACLISKGANSDSFLEEDLIFDTVDFYQLAEKIKMMLQLNVSQINAIGKNNRQYIIDNYSIKKMVGGLTSVLLAQAQ